MSAIRRFFNSDDENSVFRFQIDTRNTVAGATNGSENPLTFNLPFYGNNFTTACIVRVSDGRPDISIIGTSDVNSKCLLTFSNPGIYTISIFGKVELISFAFGGDVGGASNVRAFDRLKLIYIDSWSVNVKFGTRCFYECSNLVIRAPNSLILPSNPSWFFQGIKRFESSLTLIDTSKVIDAIRISSSILNPLPDGYNPFWASLVNFREIYNGNTFSASFNKLEVISNSITTLYQPWNSLTFLNTGEIRLICRTPNLKQMFRVFYNGQVRYRCHAGEIDVRNVTDTNAWLNGAFTTAQVDATLLGWAQLPFMQSGVAWNWNGSKYSNSPAVIAAYNKITNDWGVIFTNLTMV